MKYIEHLPWSEYWHLEGLGKLQGGGIKILFNYLIRKCNKLKTNDKEL